MVRPAPPQRIVSLVPSATETVCRLGAAARLLGCTRYCTEPAGQLGAAARVGGTKNPSRERIAALAPDLVLGNAEENRPEDLEWLAARMRVLVQTPRTVARARAAVVELGEVLDTGAAAARLAGAIDGALAAAAEADRSLGRVPARYVIWPKPWMAVGRDTYVHDLLWRAGADNVDAGAAARYPQIDPAAPARRADIVLLPDEPWVFTPAERDRLAAEGTFGAARLLLCSGRDFCWHGAHSGPGLRAALDLLRPLRPRHP